MASRRADPPKTEGRKRPKRKNGRPPAQHGVSEQELIVALQKHAGIASLAASEFGISRQAVSERIGKSDRLKAAIADIKENLMDLCEGQIIVAIRKGDRQMVRWYAERMGKGRGYATKSEHGLNETDLAAIIACFGGDPGKLAEFRRSLDPSAP